MAGIGVTALIEDSKMRLRLDPAKRPGKRKLLDSIAETYFQFVHQRHLANGNGKWAALNRATIEARRKRKEVPPKTFTKPLRDTEQLLAATNPFGGRGQVRRLDTARMTATLGISGTTVYFDPRPNQLIKKTKRKTKRAAGGQRLTLGRLAAIHATSSPRRTILVQPPAHIRNRMTRLTTEWLRTPST